MAPRIPETPGSKSHAARVEKDVKRLGAPRHFARMVEDLVLEWNEFYRETIDDGYSQAAVVAAAIRTLEDMQPGGSGLTPKPR